MGRYDGEDYATRPPCPEGQHQRAFNGSCYVCKILCTGDGLSLAERERRDLRAENERLRGAMAEIRTLADRGVAWSIHTRSQVIAVAEAALTGSSEAPR